MSGKREQQKADRQQRIIDAAEALFRCQGYEDTKIETIAREAGISVGTVYNYFETKSDIVMTLVTRHSDFIDREIETIIDNATTELEHNICNLFYAMTAHSIEHLGKENWRVLFGLSIAKPESQLGAKFAEFNERLKSRVIGLLDAMRDQGLLLKTCNTGQLGAILFEIEAMHYIRLVSEKDRQFEDYKTDLLESVRFVIAPYTQSKQAA